MLNKILLDVFGVPLDSVFPVSGGDINDAFRLTLADGRRIFMKANRGHGPAFFRAEAEGLEAIRRTGAIGVPGVIGIGEDRQYGSFLLIDWIEPAQRKRDFWETFGRSLAQMHNAPVQARFGWNGDNFIGATPQVNAPRDSWVRFFRDCRLEPQFRRAAQYFDASARRQADWLMDHLDEFLVEPPHPSLLHGDLWSGNFVTGGDGQAWLIDPAAYVGHAEADLAMTELFGGFHPDFYAAYREVSPLQPDYAQRREVYNLYHQLNHLNLFGGGYLPSVLEILRRTDPNRP